MVAEGVEDIFKLAGLERPDIGILSDAFLEEVRNLPQRNFAVELLQKLLNDEIKSRSRTNVILEKKFSDRLLAALNRYRSRAIESAQVIEELIAMAKEFREAAKRGENLGLNESELAFYDALADNESAVRELGDDILKKIAHELTEKLRNSTTRGLAEARERACAAAQPGAHHPAPLQVSAGHAGRGDPAGAGSGGAAVRRMVARLRRCCCSYPQAYVLTLAGGDSVQVTVLSCSISPARPAGSGFPVRRPAPSASAPRGR